MSVATEQHKLCFVHVPKCGGTSLNEAFRKSLGIGPISLKAAKVDAAKTLKEAEKKGIHPLDLRQKKLVSLLGKRHLRYVKGHVRCTGEVRAKFEKDWLFLTVLRDPVKRWISQYFFNLHKKHDHTKHKMILNEYFDSEVGRNSGAIYVDFFTDGSDLSTTGAENAIDNLNNFPLVGILENMTPFQEKFENLIAVPLKPVGQRNINPLSKQDMLKEMTDKQMERIREICLPDQIVYDHFKEMA